MSADGLVIMEALKAAAWERAKGELRSLIALQGVPLTPDATISKWEALTYKVNEFIEAVEDHRLHE